MKADSTFAKLEPRWLIAQVAQAAIKSMSRPRPFGRVASPAEVWVLSCRELGWSPNQQSCATSPFFQTASDQLDLAALANI
eukprot:3567286-Prorocentrum_lima.AAC.1